MIFRKSLLCLEKEKLFILSKELNYRGLICDFFDVENSSDMSEKKDLEHSFRMLKHQIIDLKKSIESNFDTLSNNIEKLDTKECRFALEIESLIYLDMVREYIKYIVNKADIINTKLSQLLRDGYNQYLPKPITGKRYSNANITSQVEYDLKNRLKKLLNDDKDILDTMIVWDYDDDYKISKYNITNKNKEHMVFKLSYWYFELSYFLPNLTHEIGHILQNNYDFLNTTSLSNTLKKSLKGYVNKDIKDELPSLSKEIFADIVSFLYHGNSYLYAMTHKLLGEGLSNSFISIYNSCYYKNKIVDTKEIKNLEISFEIAPVRFNKKRDFLFIRIYTLLKIRDLIEYNILSLDMNNSVKKRDILLDKFEFDNSIYNSVNHIRRLLNSIYDIEENIKVKHSLKNYFENYKNYQESYNSTASAIKHSIKTITNFFDENKNIILNTFDLEKNQHFERSKYNNILPTHFNEIWNKRFNALRRNKTIHRFEYRKKLHKELYEQLIDNNSFCCHNDTDKPFISLTEIEPYSMVFSKFRLDKISNYNDIEELPSHNDIVAQGKVLGMYDYMYIKKLNETYAIEKIYKPKMYSKKLKYYESYYSLMKILSDKNGELNNNKNKNILSATIQIEVMKNLNSETKDIYNDLYQDLVDINTILNKINKETYKKIEIFKSLGPKDIIIHIDQATIETIYELKKDFYNKFNRTYTTLYLNNYDLCFKDTKYYFVSNLRMSSEFTIQEFKKIYEKEEKILKISLKTGVMDYVVVWKREAKLNDIIDFHNMLLEKKLIYDIQTSIEEELK